MVPQAEITWTHLKEATSTNDVLLQVKANPNESIVRVVRADVQTAGRGRRGRAWQSESGAGLYFSVGLPCAMRWMSYLPIVTGIALAQTLDAEGFDVGLKWPNDLIAKGRKLAGVLCESNNVSAQGLVVIGIGLNLAPVNQPDALGGAGAIGLTEMGFQNTPQTREQLCEKLVRSVVCQVNRLQAEGFSGFQHEFARWDLWAKQRVCVSDQGEVLLEGRAMGLAENGAYLLETAQGLVPVLSGDLSLRLLKGRV